MKSIVAALMTVFFLVSCTTPTQEETFPSVSSASSIQEIPLGYLIEDIREPIEILGKPYQKLVSQKLVHSDRAGEKTVVIDDVSKELQVPSLQVPEFTIAHQASENILYFFARVSGPDTVGIRVVKYDVQKKSKEVSPLEEVFKFTNGDLRRINSSPRYVWAPLIDGGINTDARTIQLVDFSTESSSILVSLPETETLNGADHCDRYNFITNISLSPDGKTLTYAVYSKEKLNEFYIDACSGLGDEEMQEKNAQEAFVEYRTYMFTDASL